MPRRILVTGIEGFTGRYLRPILAKRGYEVIGLTRRVPRHASDLQLDLLDRVEVLKRVKAMRPAYVINLAAIAFVAHDDPAEMYATNILGSLNLLEALDGLPVAKVILASSANVYGQPRRVPVEESAIPAPVNHYGVTKYSMELMAARWFDRMSIVVARPFNYTGVGQDIRFVLPKLVAHFRERKPVLELGDSSVVREFMDVRDVATAYADLLESSANAEAVNLCSGIGHSLGGVLQMLEGIAGFRPKVRRSEALVRSNEIAQLVGSTRKLKQICPTVAFRPLEETLRWMVGAEQSEVEPTSRVR